MNSIQTKLLNLWQSSKNKNAKLKAIEINGLRGINSLSLEFRYPIVAIAGENGSGKTTILGCIACAYKNPSTYKPINKRGTISDYTIGNFIVKSVLDNPFHSIPKITWYHSGDGYPEHFTMQRKNKHWRPLHNQRPIRAVQFISLSRINPAIEKRVQYSDFIGNKKVVPTEIDSKLIDLTSRVLGKKYVQARTHFASKDYVLTLNKGNGYYSSFNMGSGEEVVFNILNLLIQMPKGALIIIDEVETGLHPKAQKELVNVMMEISIEKHLQIVMSTHSKVILEALPSYGRLLLIRESDKILPEYGISGEYAFSKLLDEPSSELRIYVEDKVGKSILEHILPLELRRRVEIKEIGSWTFVMKQLAAFYRDNIGNCLAVFDGDCINKGLEKNFHLDIENSINYTNYDYSDWFKNHHVLLPSEDPPEKWLMNLPKNNEFFEKFSTITSASIDTLKELFAKPEPKDIHSFFYDLSTSLSFNEDYIRNSYISLLIDKEQFEIQAIVEKVKRLLQEN